MPRIASACSSASVAVLGDLDPARLAAAADQHLRLDHARVADLVRRLDGVVDGVGDPSVGDRHAVAREELLSLVLEQVQGRERLHERRIGAAGGRQRPKSANCHNPAALMALPKLKDIKWVTTDCYGTLIDWEKGISDAFKQGGRARRPHHRREGVPGSLLRDPGADHVRLLRALRRGPAPGRGQGGRGDRLDDRALARAVPARQRRLLAPFPRGQRRHGPPPGPLRDRDHLQRRRQAARHLAPPPAHRARPGRDRAAGPQLQARPDPLRSARGGSAARRAGSTSAPTTTPTSARP